jgi:hypothetical protein
MVGDHAAPRAEVQAHFEAVLLSVIAADEKLFEAIAAAHSRSTRDRRVMSLTGEWFKKIGQMSIAHTKVGSSHPL